MMAVRILPSLMLTCCLLLGTIEATPQYQLSCPPLEEDSAGICVEACPLNGSCPSGQLCCSNGCGHSCMEAIRIPYHTPPTDSMCPPVDEDVAGTCEERCTSDSDCASGEMCCSNGCGHVCQPPMSACKAIQFSVSNQSLIGSYLPQCEEDGSFSRVQCHGSTGYCWCVEREGGVPVSGPVRFKRPQCNCTHSDVTHYVGESFPAGDGCNQCQCTLDGEVKCTEDQCPDQELFYSCPAVRADVAGICVHECSLNSDCPDSKKCCYNGCGHTCQSPIPIPYVRLSEATSCPPTTEVPCFALEREGRGSCRDPAYPCDEGEICCENECASAVCLGLVGLKPCLTARTLLLSNGSEPVVGAYRPQCDEDGLFRDIQCHEHYCWCVEADTGKPTSDMVPFEDMRNLQCSVCVYNGRKYHPQESFPSTDGCNECTCHGGAVSCTEMACLPGGTGGRGQSGRGGDEDEHLWVWWHTVLIVCIALVVVLAIVVGLLTVGVFVLMRQNGQFRHKKMKEVLPEKFEPEEVHFKTGQDSIELKVPVEEDADHKPAHA